LARSVHGVDELEQVVTEAAALFPEQCVVVAVTDASRTCVASSAGTDPNMLCEIGSVTKVMTATLVLQHVAREMSAWTTRWLPMSPISCLTHPTRPRE